MTGDRTEPIRDSQRFDHNAEVEVRCERWNHFVDMVTENVSKGGMFVATNNPPPVFTRLRVRIATGDAAPIVLEGEVRHIVSPERARARGVSPGMGVRFDELSDELRRQVDGLVHRASLPRMPAVRLSSLPPTPAPPRSDRLTAAELTRLAALEAELGRTRERDYFERLELSSDAGPDSIRRAFRERARAFHPDRYARDAPEIRALAQEIYILLNDAKKELKSAAVRDRLRHAHEPGASTAPPPDAQRVRALSRRREREAEQRLVRPSAPRPRPEVTRKAAEPAPSAAVTLPSPATWPVAPSASPPTSAMPPASAHPPPSTAPPPPTRPPERPAAARRAEAKTEQDGLRRATALAMKSLSEERYQEAIDRLVALTKRGVSTSTILLSLELARGHLGRESGDVEAARRHFERACTIDPQCIPAIRALRTLNADRDVEERGVLSRLFGR